MNKAEQKKFKPLKVALLLGLILGLLWYFLKSEMFTEMCRKKQLPLWLCAAREEITAVIEVAMIILLAIVFIVVATFLSGFLGLLFVAVGLALILIAARRIWIGTRSKKNIVINRGSNMTTSPEM